MTAVSLSTTFLLTIFFAPTTSSYRFNREEMIDYQTTPPYRTITTPEIIRQLKGTPVTLKCPVAHCNHHRKHFKWEIKHCRSDTKSVPCNQLQYETSNTNSGYRKDWKRISPMQPQTVSCQDNEKISTIVVKIENHVLYRCSVNNQIVKMYQLEVTEFKKEDDGSPRILEMSPSDVIVPINSQLILQCKVYSSMQPVQIFWFKQCDGCSDHVIYNGTHYTKINTSIDTSAVQKETNVYVSKLNIYKVGLMDNGVYACVGVNGNSFNVKTAVVTIQGVDDNWEPHAPFSLLFLIPLAFALVPITVWLCYYKNRQRPQSSAIFQQRKKLIKVNQSQVPVV